MTLKDCLNWKGLGSLPELTGILYMSELKPEVYSLNLNNFTFIIFRIRKIEQNLVIFH